MKKYSKKEIVIISSFVFLVLVSIIGVTFAWFSAQVEGNDTASTMVVEMANLKLEFTDTNIIEGDKVLPGWTRTKTFTVENLGNVAVNYDIDIIDVASTFEGQDLVYEITSTNNGGTKTETVLPNINGTLIVNAVIEPLTTQTYTIKITFKETGEDQNIDQGKSYRGKLQITPRISSVAIAGYALDGEGNPLSNRVVELHSDPVSTTTDSSGYYEFRDVEVGTHTIILKNSTNTAEEASVDVTLAYGSDVKKYNNTVVLDKTLRKYINIELNGNTIDLVVEEAELLLGESSGTTYVGANKEVEISGRGYGELSCTSSDETKATCSITNNILTIVPVSDGLAEITVTESNYNKTVTYELNTLYSLNLDFTQATTLNLFTRTEGTGTFGTNETYGLYYATYANTSTKWNYTYYEYNLGKLISLDDFEFKITYKINRTANRSGTAAVHFYNSNITENLFNYTIRDAWSNSSIGININSTINSETIFSIPGGSSSNTQGSPFEGTVEITKTGDNIVVSNGYNYTKTISVSALEFDKIRIIFGKVTNSALETMYIKNISFKVK